MQSEGRYMAAVAIAVAMAEVGDAGSAGSMWGGYGWSRPGITCNRKKVVHRCVGWLGIVNREQVPLCIVLHYTSDTLDMRFQSVQVSYTLLSK